MVVRLKDLCAQKKYNTDKIAHGYIDAYENNFENLRHKVLKFLEIGVLTGGSLEMWLDYFPNADIIGVDINSLYTPPEGSRIKVETGNIVDPMFSTYLIEKYGIFDIVLDDGSHLASDLRKSFDIYFPVTRYVYCIEDLVVQYPNNYPQGNYLDEESMMEKLYALISNMNKWKDADSEIKQISFTKWQCYIYKK